MAKIFESRPSLWRYPFYSFALSSLFNQELGGDKRRILDIGSGKASTLIALASFFKETECVALDINKKALAWADKAKQQLSINNLTTINQDFKNFYSKTKFDLIIVHGLYSWIGNKGRFLLLKTINNNLSDSGIALLTFNVLPAYNSREALKKDILQATQSLNTLDEKIEKAYKILEQIREKKHKGYVRADLLEEALYLKTQSKEFFRSEIFNQDANGDYFQDLFNKIEEAELTPFAIANPLFNSYLHNKKQDNKLKFSPQSFALMQGKFELKRNNSFREVLLCHNFLKEKLAFDFTRAFSLYITSPLVPKGNYNEKENIPPSVFYAPNGKEIKISPKDKYISHILWRLYKLWPKTQYLNEVIKDLAIMLNEDMSEIKSNIVDSLFNLFCDGLLFIYDRSNKANWQITKKPSSPSFVKVLLQENSWTINLLGNCSLLDPFEIKTVEFLNGKNNINDIKKLIFKAVQSGELFFKINQPELQKSRHLNKIIHEKLENTLLYLRDQALLAE